jgi:hypothetical protein
MTGKRKGPGFPGPFFGWREPLQFRQAADAAGPDESSTCRNRLVVAALLAPAPALPAPPGTGDAFNFRIGGFFQWRR